MDRTQPRTWMAGAAVVGVLAVSGTWFGLVAPERSQAAELRVQAEDTDAANAMLRTRIAQLEAQFTELPQRQAELAAIRRAMPRDVAMPALVRDLDEVSAGTGVTLMSLTPGVATPVVDPAAEAAAAAAAAATASAEGGTGAAGGATATGEAAAAAAVPAAPAANPAGTLEQVPVTLEVIGGFAETRNFLEELQTGLARSFLVTGLTVTSAAAQGTGESAASGGRPATSNGDVTTTVTGAVFVLRPAVAATP